MQTSNELNNIIAALVTFQAGMTTMPKPAKGYGYNYTPLDVVIDNIRVSMAESGLAFVQMPAVPPVEYGPAVALTTRLMHTSGEWIEDTMIMPVPSVGKANDAQNYGAALTYARRYALTSMLGLASDEDVNAAPRSPVKKQTRPVQHVAPSVPDQNSGNHKIADLRATIEGAGGTVPLGFVADRAHMTGKYKHANHALNAMKGYEFPDGVEVSMAQKVSRAGALKVYDWLMDRKEE